MTLWHRGDTDQDITPSPDDVLMICTGGTTGRPKGVMWRQADTYTISMNGADHQSAAEIHAKLGTPGPPWFAVSPLMHAAGMWTAFAGVLNGQTVVLYDSTKFDPDRVLSTAQRHKVGMMTMVGDAYAAPLVAALRDGSYDLSSLYALATGGRRPIPRHQRALLEMLPNIILINGYGSSETGNVGFGRSMRDDHGTPSNCAREHWFWPTTTAGSSAPVRSRSAGWRGPGEFRWATLTTPRPPA